jgi:alpha-glucuronidase
MGQYPSEVAAMYETVEKCPDDLLLFMHHVPYTQVLHSGKAVTQCVYDSHYDAASEAHQFPVWWRSLRGRIDDEQYQAVLAHLEYQARHAMVWRDAVCSWFLRMSGIHDDKGRAGYFPNRTEAESMQLAGYEVENVTPWEDASGGKAVGCGSPNKKCRASLVFTGTEGWYDISVQYFDENTGAARFQLFAGEQLISAWTAGATLPAEIPNGDSSTRERITQVRLHPNERIRIVGAPDGRDHASLDYIAITPHPDR